MSLSSTFPTVLAAFLGSAVEFVEALTIVLAVGVVRGWRAALLGAGSGILALVLIVLLGAALNTSLTQIPLPLLQTVVGVLLLMFGLRWLRKAILRGAGILKLHDEDAAFAAEVESLRQGVSKAGGFDVVAFIAAFKGVFLEGLEVVFIVVALGANGELLEPAALGASLALVAVAIVGLALHRPLARVPENLLKFCVGALLSGFGAFWAGEGLGMTWVGGDWVLPLLILAFTVTALVLVRLSRGLHSSAWARDPSRPAGASASGAVHRDGALAAAVREVWGLFVDDGLLALGILVVIAVCAGLQRGVSRAYPGAVAASFTAMLLVLLCVSSIRRAMVR
jgi:uncharacterized membrane protein